jgi:hypothetical protein
MKYEIPVTTEAATIGYIRRLGAVYPRLVGRRTLAPQWLFDGGLASRWRRRDVCPCSFAFWPSAVTVPLAR